MDWCWHLLTFLPPQRWLVCTFSFSSSVLFADFPFLTDGAVKRMTFFFGWNFLCVCVFVCGCYGMRRVECLCGCLGCDSYDITSRKNSFTCVVFFFALFESCHRLLPRVTRTRVYFALSHCNKLAPTSNLYYMSLTVRGLERG